jgi:hypothetical protein
LRFDEYEDTSVAEVAHLRSLGVFSNAEILRMWTAHCAGMFGGRASDVADGSEDGRILELGAPPQPPSDPDYKEQWGKRRAVTVSLLCVAGGTHNHGFDKAFNQTHPEDCGYRLSVKRGGCANVR